MSTADNPRLRLLLAEDEPSVTLALKAYFSSRAWTVVGVETLSEGQRAAVTTPFDLAILDLRLGEIVDGGLRLAEQIGECQPGMPIILLSGYGSQVTTERARALGIDLILAKPVRLAVLLATAMDLVLTGRRPALAPAMAGDGGDGRGGSR